jgi:hypothetical protein
MHHYQTLLPIKTQSGVYRALIVSPPALNVSVAIAQLSLTVGS